MDHDQNFKNLILDYPRAALELFAPEIAAGLPADAVITPIREEQLKERLGDRFHELDVPLLVEFPSGGRAAIVFDVEEHTDPATFRIHSLAHYALKLSEAFDTERVVPVVVLLRAGRVRRELRLGVERETFLSFRYVLCDLARLPAARYADSDNLVARLNLPNMAHAPEDRVDVYDQAIRGLVALEPDGQRRRKYLDFVDQYARLTEAERLEWRGRRKEEPVMSWWTEQEQKAKAEGEATGEAKGKANVLVSLAARGLLSVEAARQELERLVRDGDVPESIAAEMRRKLTDLH